MLHCLTDLPGSESSVKGMGGREKKTPISLWPEYWSDWVLDIVFTVAFLPH